MTFMSYSKIISTLDPSKRYTIISLRIIETLSKHYIQSYWQFMQILRLVAIELSQQDTDVDAITEDGEIGESEKHIWIPTIKEIKKEMKGEDLTKKAVNSEIYGNIGIDSLFES